MMSAYGNGLKLFWNSVVSSTLRNQSRRRLCNVQNSSQPKKSPVQAKSSQSSNSSSTSSAPPSANNADAAGAGPPPKMSLFARFKDMYKNYYYVLIPVHVVTSVGWFGGFYYASQSGVDIAKYMRKMGLSDNIVSKVTSSGMGHITVAYALYKIATPARYTVTLGGTTWAINRLQRLGYIKPAKEIISKGKERLLQRKN